ncbi:hypothetical protein ABZ912_56500 [Nonomuraea angiospora]|uniref:hypothetical protein n=1 Tax=Nonomuraea angiospora TaxID=46172 RepID=UPI0033FD65F5
MSGFILWKVRNTAGTVATAGAVGAFVAAGEPAVPEMTGEHWSRRKSDYHLEILR